MVLAVTLMILNIPVYLFIGWVVFDTKGGAKDTFLTTILIILKAIFVPQIVRAFMEDEDEGGAELFMVFAFFVACIAAVVGEYYLIDKYILSTG